MQKLHSAVSTFAHAKKGIIVTSSSFSTGAREYAHKLKVTTGVEIELWDYHALLDHAKSANIFLTSGRQNTAVYFHVPWRTSAEVVRELKQRYISKLMSSPRAARDSIIVRVNAQDVVPVILVNYKIEKAFATQAGVIHRVSERGRRVHVVPGYSLTLKEQEYWLNSKIFEYAVHSIEGKQLPTFFGRALNAHSDSLKNELAKTYTSTVQYVGKNNQAYSKHCEIKRSDVQTSTQQVLLSRWEISLLIGPRSFELVLADDASQELLIPQHQDSTGASKRFYAERQ